MANRTVTLIIRFRAADGTWKRASVPRGGNGRVKPKAALIAGKAVEVEDFTYLLRHYEGRKLKYTPAGTNAADADAQRARLAKKLDAKIVASDAGLRVEIEEERKALRTTAKAYIEDAEHRSANEAALQARSVSGEFMTVIGKTFVDEVVRQDFFRFHAALRKRGCGDRTIANKHTRLASWLRFAGIDKSIIPPVPKYDQQLPTVYSKEQTRALLEAADDYMKIAILLALKCGLRDQELIHSEFSDIDWTNKVIRIRSKPKHGFVIKDREERDVALPDDVVAALKQWGQDRPGQSLILGKADRRPNKHLLRNLKQLAKRAGLNCGRCDSCRERGECTEFTLHQFRRTFLTTLLQSGIDLRTAQQQVGHSDLQSTMRYLRPAAGEAYRAKLKAVEW